MKRVMESALYIYLYLCNHINDSNFKSNPVHVGQNHDLLLSAHAWALARDTIRYVQKEIDMFMRESH